MKLFLMVLAFCVVQTSFGQQFNAFTAIESKNGLSENNVRNIAQLPDGRMVIITKGMVNVYNGSSFQYIHFNALNFYPLSGYTGFHHSYADREGRLWIKNHGKLMLIDMRHERFESHTDSILGTLGVGEPLSDFFMDTEQNLWLVTIGGKLLYRNTLFKKTRIFLNNVFSNPNHTDPLYDLAVFQNQLFLFYRSGLFVSYSLSTGKELFRSNSLKGKKPEMYNRTLFVVPGNHTLYMLRNGKGGIMLAYNAQLKKWNTILETDYVLNCLSVGKNGEAFLSCRLGLWTFTPDLSKRSFVPALHLVDGRSIETEVSTLYHDLQGGFWLGTLNRGLLYYHPDRFRLKNLDKSRFLQLKKGNLAVSSFAEDDSGRMLVGTSIGLFFYATTAGKLLPFSAALSDVKCNGMLRDHKKRVWLATDDGLYRISDHSVHHYPLGRVKSITEFGEDEFYLGIEGSGLLKFNSLTARTEQVPLTTIQGERIFTVNQVVSWKEWLLGITNAGLFMYNTHTKYPVLINRFGKAKSEMFGHGNQQYNCLFTDSRGLLWFGTQDGLNVWNSETGRLQTFHDAEGLVNNTIQAIVEDQVHTLWVSTANGISQLKLVKKPDGFHYSFANFNNYDGVINNEFMARSAYLTQRDRLFFGGIDGFNEIDLKHIPATQKKIKPLFVSLALFGKEILPNKIYEGNRILSQSITVTDQLHLNHNQNFLTVGFSALNYVNPLQTFYQYYLEGIDEDWQNGVAADGLGYATYTNLPPGKYLFKVRAADNSKDWNGAITTMVIVIHPPWWTSSLAILCYSLGFLILLCRITSRCYRRFKVKRAKVEKDELDELKLNFKIKKAMVIKPASPTLTGLDEQLIQKALQCITQNMANPAYSVEQFSADMNMDRTGLYRKMVAAIGQTPSDFMRSVRLENAAALILQKVHSIAEISDRVGFSNVTYFSKCFHQKYGVRPSQYAAQITTELAQISE